MSDYTDKSEVAIAYDRWAETYDSDPNRTRELASAVLRQRHSDIAGRDLIEIGCGTGHNTQWLAERARNILAVDFSEGMLLQARARLRSSVVRFVRQDIRTAWPAADASADLVIIMLVLEHIEDLEPIYAEAARVLRVGGGLFICELHPMRQMSGRQAEFTDRETGKQERIAAYLHDISEYVNTGLGAGFELVRLGEWRDPNSPRNEMPRVLSVEVRLRARPGL
jgi:malonyl-CoA O-methyltransferase